MASPPSSSSVATAASSSRPSAGLRVLGVDFSCAPSRRKPITVAHGRVADGVLRYECAEALTTLGQFEALLREPGPWLGGFDFPFGLPRAFVDAHGLGDTADAVIANLHARCGSRMAFRQLVDAWGNGRAPGTRLLHRRTDTAVPGVSSSSPLQTRYVPVGFMYYEGFARLVAAGVHVPGLRRGAAARTAVEAYPGLLAFELIGRRSYKNSDALDRLIARKDIVDALEQGRTRLGLRLKLTHAQRESLADDASGDRLDAVLCLAQAAWAAQQPDAGVPADADPVEGWLATSGPDTQQAPNRSRA